MSLDFDATSKERERAFARFEAIFEVHSAAIDAFLVLAALPDAADLVATSVQLRLGMKPGINASRLDEHASEMLKVIEDEKAHGYEVIRSSALVAVCGAFEYLVKATFVDQAAGNPQMAAGLIAKAKLRLPAAKVLGASAPEQWFAIADRLFEDLSEASPQMHERVQKFLLEYTYLPFEESQVALKVALAKIDPKTFNEAFLVRNCIVHNGGRVSTQLARMAALQVGEPISFVQQGVRVRLKPIRELAGSLNLLWMAMI